MPIPANLTRYRFPAGWLIALPIAVWLWVLLRYAANVVFNDDYALLIFIARWHDPALSWSTQLTDLVALHNTHRIIYDRLVCLVTYYLTGQLNVTVMIGMGNLALLGICWQLGRGFRQLGLPVWYFLPIPCWLLSLQSHENMFWGMAGLQNFTVIWFVLEALHQLHRRAPLIWPLLLSIGAALTSGNGILAFLIGALLLVSQQRRDRSLVVWGISTVVVLLLMLVLFPAAHERTPILTWVPNACLALGSAFTNQTTTGLPMVGGIVLTGVMGLALLGWLTRFGQLGQRLRQLPVTAEWLAFGLFVLATALLLAMHRLPDELLRERYKVYAHLMLSLVYLLLLAISSRRLQVGWAVSVTLLAALMNLFAFHACLPRVVGGYLQRQADAFNFQANQTTLGIPAISPYSDSLLVRSHQEGIYRFPRVLKPRTDWAAVLPTDSLRISSYQDDLVHNAFLGEHPCYIQLECERVVHRLTDATDQGLYFVVESADQHTYLFPAPPEKGAIRGFMTGKGPFKPGSVLTFLSSRLKAGDYRVNLLRIVNNSYQLVGYRQPLEIRTIY